MGITEFAAPTYTLSRLAGLAGLSADTVRYYEGERLLPPPARTPAGYRHYDASMVERLAFVAGCQRLGLTLSDIRDLLAAVRDTGVCPCEPAEEHLTRRLAEVEAELARVVSLRAQMVAMLAAIPSGDCPPPARGTWCPPNPERGCPDVRRQLLRRIVRLRQRLLLLSARLTGCWVKDQSKVHAPGDPDVESNSIEHSSRPPLR